jgi:hypothetical protein
VAATHRSQARDSSGEDASRAPRTWLVSNLAKGKAFEHLHFKGKKLIKDPLFFSVVSRIGRYRSNFRCTADAVS